MKSFRFFAASLMVLVLAGTSLTAAADAPLANAVQRRDANGVRELLAKRTDVNATQVDGMTALHWAVYYDDAALAGRLLDAGANARASNRYGVTPLSIACTNGNVAIVERLLAAGADANATLDGGETMLMTAARTGNAAVVRALIARGADVNARESRNGQTALMWAAAEGHIDATKALIAAGADFRASLESGFTPLLFAAREGRIGVVKLLVEIGANVNEPVEVRTRPRLPEGTGALRSGLTPLLLAVSNGHFELANELLNAGADPNSDLLGYTALHAVVKVRNPGIGDNDPAPEGSGTMTSLEFVKQLVAHGAKINARMTKRPNLTNTRFNELGATPFLLASVTADGELMKTLQQLGADPLLANNDGSTPLMAAAGLGTRSPGEDAGTEEEVIEAMGILLGWGADINAVDSHGETAMHGAAYKNLPEAVRFLAAKGASVEVWNRRNEYGWTPLTIARGYRFGNFKPSAVTMAAIEEVMLSAGVKPPSEKEEQAVAVDIYAAPRPAPPAPPK
jgi:ankyrin repeat protein